MFHKVSESEVIQNSKEEERRGAEHKQVTTRQRQRYSPLDLGTCSTTEPFTKYFMMKFDANTKRSVNPYDVQKKVKQITGTKSRVSTLNRTLFLIEAVNKDKAGKMNTIDAIREFKCETTAYDRYNYSKGIIYLSESGIGNVDEFQRGMQERYPVVGVERASFIKTRVNNSIHCNI